MLRQGASTSCLQNGQIITVPLALHEHQANGGPRLKFRILRLPLATLDHRELAHKGRIRQDAGHRCHATGTAGYYAIKERLADCTRTLW